jgi:hypothetical protein
LALKLRFADEQRQHGIAAPVGDVLARRLGHAAIAGELAASLTARNSALRRPASWVPPSGVGMVLQ